MTDVNEEIEVEPDGALNDDDDDDDGDVEDFVTVVGSGDDDDDNDDDEETVSWIEVVVSNARLMVLAQKIKPKQMRFQLCQT